MQQKQNNAMPKAYIPIKQSQLSVGAAKQNNPIYQSLRLFISFILLFFESFSADPVYLRNAYQIDDESSFHTTPQHQIDYEYDPHGNRIAEVLDGARTKFMVDSSRAYAQVVEERQNGALTKRYIFGNDLLSWTEGGKSYYPLSDHLQSVMQVSDANGQIVGSNTFDAYGGNVKTTGDITSRHQFIGERFSPETGLLHLRAREYDPSVGRFTSRDPFPGFSQDPQTLHKYIYANNDPVNRVDRSGLFSLGEVMSVAQVSRMIRGINGFFVKRTGLRALEKGIASQTNFYIKNSYKKSDSATLVVHGVAYHEFGYAGDFIDELERRYQDTDYLEYVWSGFSLHLWIVPHPAAHKFVKENIKYILKAL